MRLDATVAALSTSMTPTTCATIAVVKDGALWVAIGIQTNPLTALTMATLSVARAATVRAKRKTVRFGKRTL